MQVFELICAICAVIALFIGFLGVIGYIVMVIVEALKEEYGGTNEADADAENDEWEDISQ